jgi:hypothetical protein
MVLIVPLFKILYIAVCCPTFLYVQLSGEAARPAGGDVEGVVVGPTQPLTVPALHLHSQEICSFGAVGENAPNMLMRLFLLRTKHFLLQAIGPKDEDNVLGEGAEWK